MDEARQQGKKAFAEGKPRDANPYDPADRRHTEWDAGWCIGRRLTWEAGDVEVRI